MGSYFVNVAGESRRNNDGTWRQDVIGRCTEGQPVALIREPDNPHDGNAILVATRSGIIGYVAADKAEWMAPRLDAGRPCTGWIHAIRNGGGRMSGVVLLVRTDGDAGNATASDSPEAVPRKDGADPSFVETLRVGLFAGAAFIAMLMLGRCFSG